MAIADKLGLNRMTREQWLKLAQMKKLPMAKDDLFAPEPEAAQQVADVKPASVEEKALSADLSRSVATKTSTPIVKRKSRFTRFQGGRRLN
jgi:hypothetical protein